MASSRAVTVDAKGRVLVPADVRDELGIHPGDVLFVESDEAGGVLRYAKALNPFDVLAGHAEAEYRAGKTRRLRDFSAEHDIHRSDE